MQLRFSDHSLNIQEAKESVQEGRELKEEALELNLIEQALTQFHPPPPPSIIHAQGSTDCMSSLSDITDMSLSSAPRAGHQQVNHIRAAWAWSLPMVQSKLLIITCLLAAAYLHLLRRHPVI